MNLSNNDIADSVYSYIREYAMLKMQSELKREESLIQQATNMQSAFAFTTAALFMVASIIVDNKGGLPNWYLILTFSTITLFLLLSLLFASMAQNRQLVESFDDIETVTKHIEENYEAYSTVAQREKAMSEIVSKVQKSRCESNDKRAKRIMLSMRFFYIALGLIAFWFLSGIIFL